MMPPTRSTQWEPLNLMVNAKSFEFIPNGSKTHQKQIISIFFSYFPFKGGPILTEIILTIRMIILSLYFKGGPPWAIIAVVLVRVV